MLFWLVLIFLFCLILLVLILQFILPSPPSAVDLKKAHIVITGGSSGIGKAIAIAAVKQGAKVTLIARNKTKLEEAKTEVSSFSPSDAKKEVVCILSVDLSGDYEPVERSLIEAEACLGPIDILINCAGIAYPGRFDEVPISDFKRQMDMNYMSAVHTTRAALPGMKARGRGRIVFLSSQAGQLGVYGYTAYSASKFALRGMAEALQMELKPYNIYVTLSFPPDTDTPGLKEESKSKPQETVLISGTSSLTDADTVAKTILDDTMNGRFLSSVGLNGWLLSCLTCGFAPVYSMTEAMLQMICMGVFRLVSVFVLYDFNKAIQSCKTQRESDRGLSSSSPKKTK